MELLHWSELAGLVVVAQVVPTDEQTLAGFGKQQKTQEKVSFQAFTCFLNIQRAVSYKMQ